MYCICSSYQIPLKFVWNSWQWLHMSFICILKSLSIISHKFNCVPYELHMKYIWNSCNLYEVRMKIIWSSHEDHMKFIWSSYDVCMKHTCLPVQISCQVHMKFIWFSYKIDMKFRWIAYDFISITFEIHAKCTWKCHVMIHIQFIQH